MHRRAAAVLLVLTTLAAASAARADTASAAPAVEESALVVRVKTGDTFLARTAQGETWVHLLGVVAISRRMTDAGAHLADLIDGRTVVLRTEPEVPDRDEGGVLLRLVLLDDGRCVNEAMIRDGYAIAHTRYPFAALPRYVAFESEARASGVGLWKTDPKLFETEPGDPGVVSNPELIPESRVVPLYPKKARARRQEGRVILQAVIRKDGTVGDLEVLNAPPAKYKFDEAAKAAVKQWRYRPALFHGEPVDVYFTIVVDFVLR